FFGLEKNLQDGFALLGAFEVFIGQMPSEDFDLFLHIEMKIIFNIAEKPGVSTGDREKLDEVFMHLFRKIRFWDVLQGCQEFPRMNDECRLVGFSTHGNWSKKGSIRFNQDAIQGNRERSLPQSFRIPKRHDS